MISHKDEIPPFYPKGKVRLIILGTMGSINARSIDGVRPSEDFFYYNNSRNHFWKVLQLLFEPHKEPLRLSIPQKKAFLQKWGIAITNIVDEALVPNKDKLDPSDTVLFLANKKKRISFKSLSPKMRKLFQTTPLFFTCRRKKGIENLLQGFLETNKLSPKIIENVWYWATPTRCNPRARSEMWRREMSAHLNAIANNE